jgi:HSP20 family protein
MDFNLRPFAPRRTTSLRPQPNQEPIAGTYQDMSRMFEDMLTALTRAPWTSAPPQRLSIPKMEASETDKEISIVTELPGVSPQDIEVSLDDDVLTIRAESRSESTAEGPGKRDFHLMERDYGSVMRSFRLPFSPDPQQVDAILQDGLLTIHVAKPQTVQDKVCNIPVRTAMASAPSPDLSTDGGVAAEGAPPAGQTKTASPPEQETPHH